MTRTTDPYLYTLELSVSSDGVEAYKDLAVFGVDLVSALCVDVVVPSYSSQACFGDPVLQDRHVNVSGISAPFFTECFFSSLTGLEKTPLQDGGCVHPADMFSKDEAYSGPYLGLQLAFEGATSREFALDAADMCVALDTAPLEVMCFGDTNTSALSFSVAHYMGDQLICVFQDWGNAETLATFEDGNFECPLPQAVSLLPSPSRTTAQTGTVQVLLANTLIHTFTTTPAFSVDPCMQVLPTDQCLGDLVDVFIQGYKGVQVPDCFLLIGDSTEVKGVSVLLPGNDISCKAPEGGYTSLEVGLLGGLGFGIFKYT